MPTAGVSSTQTGNDTFYSDEESSEYSDFTESYEDSEDDDDVDSFYGSSKSKSKSKSKSTKSSTKTTTTSNDAAASFFGGSSAATPSKSSKSNVNDFFGGANDDDDFDEFSSDDDDEPVVSKPKQQQQQQKPQQQSSSDAFFGFGSSSTPQQQAQPQRDLLNTDLLGINLDSPPMSSMGNSPLGFTNEVKRENLILLKQVVSHGLQVEYLFLRRSSIQGPRYNPIQLYFVNNSDNTFREVKVTGAKDSVVPFDTINVIPPYSKAEGLLNVKFASPTMPVKLTISHQENSYNVELQPAPGELISQSDVIQPSDFASVQKKLGGMNEQSGKFPTSVDNNNVASKVIGIANVVVLSNDVSKGVFQFAGKSVLDGNDVLVSVEVREAFCRLKVNCSNAIFGTTLFRELKKVLEKK